MPHSFGRLLSPKFDDGAHHSRVILAVSKSEEGIVIKFRSATPFFAACGWPGAACGWRSSRFYKARCVVRRYLRRVIRIYFGGGIARCIAFAARVDLASRRLQIASAASLIAVDFHFIRFVVANGFF